MDDQTAAAPLAKSSGPDARPMHSSSADMREALLERDLNDVYLMLDHLSGRHDTSISALTIAHPTGSGGQLDMISAICRIRWPLPTAPLERAEQAAILFKARDKLNEFASPANGLSIAYTVMVVACERAGLWSWLRPKPPANALVLAGLAERAYPGLVYSARSFRRWISILQWMLLGCLLLTSLLSWNVASGKLILQRIDRLEASAIEIGRALDAGETGDPGSAAPAGEAVDAEALNLPAYRRFCGSPSPQAVGAAGAARDAAAVRRSHVCEKAGLVIQRRRLVDRDLDEWSSYWGWLKWSAALFNGVPADVYSGTETPGPAAQADTGRGSSLEQWSADLVVVLGNFVLPMFYGFLGATTAVVLDIQTKLRQSRLAPRDQRMSQVQLVLGIIVGACIGLFLSPSSPEPGTAAAAGGAVTAGGSVALSASALSFLAGFGVESVFKMLQNMLQAMFGGQPTAPPATGATPSAQPEARS